MFIRQFQIFRLFGIPIRIDLSWFIIVIILTWSLASHFFPFRHPDLSIAAYWLMGLAGTLGLFLSVLLHELGHALVAIRNGMRMNGITLFIFGGVAELRDEPPSALVEFLVAIAGPIVSVVLAVGLSGAWFVGVAMGAPVEVTAVAGYLGAINALLVVFNMIPAFPLDGGRVLRSILWHTGGSLRRATRITSTIGSGFGILLIAFGVFLFVGGNFIGGMWMFLIGLFLRGAASASYQQLLVRRALEGESVQRFMKTDLVTVPPDITLDRLVNDYFYRHYHKMYPVAENGHAIGCITTRQVKEVPPEQWSETRVADIAQPCGPENTISVHTDAMEALSRMSRNDNSRLMVMDEGRLVGVIALKDLLRFLSLKVEMEEAEA